MSEQEPVAGRAIWRAVLWTAAGIAGLYLGLSALRGALSGADYAWRYILDGRVSARFDSLAATDDSAYERFIIITMMASPCIAVVCTVLALRGGTERQDRIADHVKRWAIVVGVAALAYGGYLNFSRW